MSYHLPPWLWRVLLTIHAPYRVGMWARRVIKGSHV